MLPTREVLNSSESYLNKVAHTIEIYQDDLLVEVKEEWGNIKLAPGETKSYSHRLDNNDLTFNRISTSVNDISIMDVAK